MEKDQKYMKLALSQAEKGRYQTWKNPMVGAVIVKDNQVLATGYHHRYGQIHAERDAISKLTPEQLFNSTLYVTLEPCNHYGKQPPCSDLIIKNRIKRVVIGQIDPHKLVTGKGVAKLKAHGIEVVTRVLEKDCQALNKFYSYFYQNEKPWITVKQATSLDYRVNATPNTRTAITNHAVYDLVHRERAKYQAIMIGSTTAIVDNPSLLTTVKSDYPPIRLVIDRRGRLLDHLNLKLLTDQKAPTWIFTQNPKLGDPKLAANVKVIELQTSDFTEVVNYLTENEIQSVYVEGGPTLSRAVIKSRFATDFIEYLNPQFLGKNGQSALVPDQNIELKNLEIENLAGNLRIAGEINV